MSTNDKKPIPLNYARPDTSRPQGAVPKSDNIPRGLDRGTLASNEATANVFETSDRGDMAFASRALAQNKIAYCVVDVPATGAAYKHPVRLMIRQDDAEKAMDILKVVLERRQRAKKLAERKNDGFKTVSEGGTWPDPLAPKDGGYFPGF